LVLVSSDSRLAEEMTTVTCIHFWV